VIIDAKDIDALRDEEREMGPRKRGSDTSHTDDMKGKEQLKKIGFSPCLNHIIIKNVALLVHTILSVRSTPFWQ
jgi:hypothetical protein